MCSFLRSERLRLAVPEGSLISVFVWSMPRISIRLFEQSKQPEEKFSARVSFVPGEPYLFCRDPGSYEVEIWYELRTPFDPPKA